jgi:hypothetical protein
VKKTWAGLGPFGFAAAEITIHGIKQSSPNFILVVAPYCTAFGRRTTSNWTGFSHFRKRRLAAFLEIVAERLRYASPQN